MRIRYFHRSRSAAFVFPQERSMNRRNFLQSSSAAVLAQSLPFAFARAQESWRTFETVTRVEIKDAFGLARAWVPLPLVADTDWQKTIGNSWSGNAARAAIEYDGKYGIGMLYAEWSTREMNPVVEVTSR